MQRRKYPHSRRFPHTSHLLVTSLTNAFESIAAFLKSHVAPMQSGFPVAREKSLIYRPKDVPDGFLFAFSDEFYGIGGSAINVREHELILNSRLEKFVPVIG